MITGVLSAVAPAITEQRVVALFTGGAEEWSVGIITVTDFHCRIKRMSKLSKNSFRVLKCQINDMDSKLMTAENADILKRFQAQLLFLFFVNVSYKANITS